MDETGDLVDLTGYCRCYERRNVDVLDVGLVFPEGRDADPGRRSVPQCRAELHRIVPAFRSRVTSRSGRRIIDAGFPRCLSYQRRKARPISSRYRRTLQGDGSHFLDGQVRRHLQRSLLHTIVKPVTLQSTMIIKWNLDQIFLVASDRSSMPPSSRDDGN